MKIRTETPADRTAAAVLIARTYGVLGADLIAQAGRLREWQQFGTPQGYFLEEDGTCVAYGLFTPIRKNGEKVDAVVLAPFAFDVLHEKVDTVAFLREVCEKLHGKGIEYVALIGSESDNSELGFKSAKALGFDVTQKPKEGDILVKVLGDKRPSGALKLPDLMV